MTDPRKTYEYQQASIDILANSDLCHLCHHHGAKTIDHLVSVTQWLATHGNLDGVNHPTNLAPAHGTRGPRRPANPCPTCGQLCNQQRGDRSLTPQPRSQDWG